MPRTRKSPTEATALGAHLRSRRKALGLVLQEVAQGTGVDVGQLSRFEAGRFSVLSTNLQKVLDFLQAREQAAGTRPELVSRFALLLERSARHKAAAQALVTALEQFES